MVSVIIPVFNGQQFISESIKSILAQTYQNFELIIVDDGSSDLTPTIIKEFQRIHPNKIKIITNHLNEGVSAARNKGIKASSAEWILFLDADDCVVDTLLEVEMEYVSHFLASKDEPLALVYPAYVQMDENGELSNEIIRGEALGLREAFGSLLVRNQIVTSGLLASKLLLLEHGGFDEQLSINEDWDLWLKMSQSGYFGYIDEPLVQVRRHSSNVTKDITNVKEAELNILKKYPLNRIKHAIFNRQKSNSQNCVDYISILYRLDLWEEGIQELQTIGNKEDNASIKFLEALYYIHHGETQLAKSCLQKVLLLDSNHGAALNNLAVMMALEGNMSEAMILLHKALTNYPNYIDASKNLSTIKQGKRDYKYTWRELRPVLLHYEDG